MLVDSDDTNMNIAWNKMLYIIKARQQLFLPFLSYN